jgi:hypothetical protein
VSVGDLSFEHGVAGGMTLGALIGLFVGIVVRFHEFR